GGWRRRTRMGRSPIRCDRPHRFDAGSARFLAAAAEARRPAVRRRRRPSSNDGAADPLDRTGRIRDRGPFRDGDRAFAQRRAACGEPQPGPKAPNDDWTATMVKRLLAIALGAACSGALAPAAADDLLQ